MFEIFVQKRLARMSLVVFVFSSVIFLLIFVIGNPINVAGPLTALAVDDEEGKEKLQDPLGLVEDKELQLTEILARVARVLMGLVGSLSLLFFIIGGYWLLTSGGKQEQIQKGKQTLVWATIGVVLSLLSFVILNFIIQTFAGKE